jgi:type I restriction enzyme S subunit
VPLAFRISGKTWVNNHAHVLKPNPDTSIGFLTNYLESLNYKSLNSGTAQPKLNKQKCSAIGVVVPPLPEQRAIAAALSDVDGLLGALDRLIAKKRDLKQAAMQQLLTAKPASPASRASGLLRRLGISVSLEWGGHPHG